MRIGGNILKPYNTIEEWLEQIKDLGYSAVLSPVDKKDPTEEAIATYLEAAKENNLIIGEVGVWNNPMSMNPKERSEAIKYCKERLSLAERLGANCCVNISGSRGQTWDGLSPLNYTQESYDLLVETIQEIIDAVNPVKSFYTLEPMPWMVPDSPQQYLQLIKDVDRKAFGVHLDFINMINNPQRYAMRDDFIKECFELLGPYIKSIHLKDIKLQEGLPIRLEECMVGQGDLDLGKVLILCESLGEDVTVFVEHMFKHEDYKNSVAYVRALAKEVGVVIK